MKEYNVMLPLFFSFSIKARSEDDVMDRIRHYDYVNDGNYEYADFDNIEIEEITK